MKNWKIFLMGLCAATILSGCGGKKDGGKDAAAVWPNKPVEVVLHASAGGDTDFNARTIWRNSLEKETKNH